MISLNALIHRLELVGLVRRKRGHFTDIDIDHLAYDSRRIGPGGLFVAVRGEIADGHLFIDKAVQNKAVAIVCEAIPADASTRFAGIAFVHVMDSRAALAELAAAFYGDPSQELKMVGITGTNGKTTTATLIRDLMESQGTKTGLLGTIAYHFGESPVAATHTTPDAIEINRMLRQMVKIGYEACVMEVSSHALAQDRVRSLDFDVALFSNLTRDHLDYHRSFQEYLAAKKKLFDGLPEDAMALYNADDPAGLEIIEETKAQVTSYGLTPDADLHAKILTNRIEGLRLRVDGKEQAFRLVGRFNAYNLLAAYGAGRALGIPPASALLDLAKAEPVPGRFEQICFSDGTTVVVDYAHTPDALENVLRTLRDVIPETTHLWCVFGCGGDRDPVKRRYMGGIAECYADALIVTSDNPRTEDPDSILNDIRRGMDHPTEARWIVQRRDAIREAALLARPGDVVLVAGKGHETYQVIGTERIPFDDREEVRRSFAPHNSNP